MFEDFKQITADAHHDRLGFGIAHPAVEFKDFDRPRCVVAWANHETRIEEARERDSVGVHTADRGLDDFAHDALVDCVGDHGCRRVGAHAARIRALVAILQAFVILAGRQWEDVQAIAKDDEACLFAKQALFNDDARARGAERAVAEHGVDSRVGLVQGHRDHDAFAGGQAVSLDHDRRATVINVDMGSERVGKRLVGGCRDAMAHHERLGEILGAFELCGGACRPENGQAAGTEGIDDPGGQRCLWPDDGQRDPLSLHEVSERRGITDRDVGGVRHQRRAAVARRDVHVLNLRRLEKLPGEGVFAAARADDEQFHR